MADDPYARIAQLKAENAALRSEVGRLRPSLAEALEQQTATAEVLGVIACSQADVQPVLDTIATSAMRLSRSIAVGISLRVDGDDRWMRVVAQAGDKMSNVVGDL